MPANADDCVRFGENHQSPSRIELWRGAQRGSRRHCDGLSSGQCAHEGVAAGRQTADFDLPQRSRHQRRLGAPALDRTFAVCTSVVFPDRHDRKARGNDVHRRVKDDAHMIGVLGLPSQGSIRIDRPRIRRVLRFAPRNLQRGDIRDIFLDERPPSRRRKRGKLSP